MASTPTPPPVPSPAQLTASQTALNNNAQETSLVNQSNPFGSINYSYTTDPTTGARVATSNTQYSAPEQQLVNNLLGYQSTASSAGESLLNNSASQYSTTPNFNDMAGGLTQQLLGQETSYLNPQFNYQTSQLDTQLRNQGLTPDSPAYKQQMMNLQLNQNQAVTGFLASAEPAAFQQAVQGYELPLQTASALMQAGAPQSLNFQNPTGAQVAPANLATAYGVQQQQYANQVQAANAQNQMLGGILGAGASLLAAPVTGGTSLLGLGLGGLGGAGNSYSGSLGGGITAPEGQGMSTALNLANAYGAQNTFGAPQ